MGGANAGGGRGQRGRWAGPSRPLRSPVETGCGRRTGAAGGECGAGPGLAGEGTPGRGSPVAGVGFTESEGQREEAARPSWRLGPPPPLRVGPGPAGRTGPDGAGWARAFPGQFLGCFRVFFVGFFDLFFPLPQLSLEQQSRRESARRFNKLRAAPERHEISSII